MHNQALVVATAVAACAPLSKAAIQTWEMGGTVDTLSETAGFTGGATTWSAIVTIDTSTPDLEAATNYGRYAATFDVTVGTVNFSFIGEFGIFDSSTDQAAWGTISGPASGSGFNNIGMQVDLGGPSSLFSGDSIPQPLPDFSTFGVSSSSVLMQAFQPGGAGFLFSGTTTYLIAAPAPGAIGLLGLGALRRRRR